MENEAASATVILDCGSSHLRAGFGGERGPRLDIPTLVGYPRHRGLAMAAGMNEQEVGEEALLKQGVLNVHQPIRNGFIDDWGDIEKLWSHIFFNELRVSPETHCFTMTQPVNTPALQKEKTLEILMETFHAHSLYLGTSQVLSLYSYGLTTGLVVDSGKDMTRAVPVHEGYALGRHVTQTPIAGAALTKYLSELLRREGYALGTATEREILSQAKADLCFVRRSAYMTQFGSSIDASTTAASLLRMVKANESTATRDMVNSKSFRNEGKSSALQRNLSSGPAAASDKPENDAVDGGEGDEVENVAEESFVLPDGQRIPLRQERYRTTEVLFDFSLLSSDYDPQCKVRTDMGDIFVPSFPKGISWLPFAAVNNCEVTLQPQLYANIVMAGNTLSFPGTRDRLEAELQQLYRESHPSEAVAQIRVRDMQCRGYSAWLGGSLLSRTSMFHHLVVSRKEYEEEGLRVIHCKSL